MALTPEQMTRHATLTRAVALYDAAPKRPAFVEQPEADRLPLPKDEPDRTKAREAQARAREKHEQETSATLGAYHMAFAAYVDALEGDGSGEARRALRVRSNAALLAELADLDALGAP